jgi:hypothetical protein
MSIADQNRIRELERRCDELESRLAIVERAESYAVTEPVPRRPGRPRKVVDEQIASG